MREIKGGTEKVDVYKFVFKKFCVDGKLNFEEINSIIDGKEENGKLSGIVEEFKKSISNTGQSPEPKKSSIKSLGTIYSTSPGTIEHEKNFVGELGNKNNGPNKGNEL